MRSTWGVTLDVVCSRRWHYILHAPVAIPVSLLTLPIHMLASFLCAISVLFLREILLPSPLPLFIINCTCLASSTAVLGAAVRLFGECECFSGICSVGYCQSFAFFTLYYLVNLNGSKLPKPTTFDLDACLQLL